MAAVAVGSVKQSVMGDMRANIYAVTVTASGDTLDVGFGVVVGVFVQPTANAPTGIAFTVATPAPGSTRLTFTSPGSFATNLLVLGY